jgi:hypothetical protein
LLATWALRSQRDQHQDQPLMLGLDHSPRARSRRASARRIASQLKATSSNVPPTVMA